MEFVVIQVKERYKKILFDVVMPDIIWLINLKFANAAHQSLYALSGGCLEDEYVDFKSPVSLNGALLLIPLSSNLADCC